MHIWTLKNYWPVFFKMKAPWNIITLICLLLLCFGCSHGANRKEGMKEIPGIPGKITERVPCTSNPDFSYALYLPAAFDKNKFWPLLLAFDPGGSGMRPVERYKLVAEHYGFILMGSNDSRNGQTLAQTELILQALFADIHNRFPVDTSRLFLTGFSGGSRIASLTAMFYGGVRGVIGCGAGLPVNRPPLFKFDYFGLVGTSDFNLTEMTKLPVLFDQYHIRHYIGSFSGGHDWPPADCMETAFLWMLLNRLRDSNSPIDDTLVQHLDQKLHSLSEYPTYLQTHPEILQKEGKEQQILSNAFMGKDITWWEKKINAYQFISTGKPSKDDSLMYLRLLSWIGQTCYSNLLTAMVQDDRTIAARVIPVYELAEPNNPEPNFIASILAVRNNDPDLALKELKIAIKKGFNDRPRVMRQKEYDKMRENLEFFDLVQQMQ